MKKILLIGGSTGVGKTKLACMCKDLFNGYLISCDSMQIYKDMNIGTAKSSLEEQKYYPQALLDIVNPNQEFSVAEYVELCKKEIEKAFKQNKLPILVGGTGLYMKSLLFPYSFSKTAKNEELREHYKKLCEEKGNEFVYNILKEKSPERAKMLHYNDTKRVIRSLEIIDSGEDFNQENISPVYDYELIVLTLDRAKLYDKINERVDKMFTEGLLDEVENVIKKYNLNQNSQSMSAIGYKEFFEYFNGQKTLDEVKELIKMHSRNYAKRQITWFKTMPNAKFFELEKLDEILNYLKENL